MTSVAGKTSMPVDKKPCTIVKKKDRTGTGERERL
jgi:hypothetical protein